MYRRFAVGTCTAASSRQVDLKLYSADATQGGKPVMVLDGTAYSIEDRRLLEGYVYESFLRAVLAQVRSHYLFHAGVVARNGRAVVLAADSAHGKTTLVLDLVRRGFAFLSDDVAALSRADGRVYPFPRSLRVRKATLALVGMPELARVGRVWLDKLLLDFDALGIGQVSAPVPLGAIIVVEARQRLVRPTCDRWEICFVLDRASAALIADVERLEGMHGLNLAVHEGRPVLRVWVRQSGQMLEALEGLLARHQVTVLDTIKRPYVEPRFDQPALLRPISQSEAARELLRRFLGGQHSALLHEELAGSASRMLLDVAAAIAGVACYRLSVGPLDEMAAHVCSIAETWSPEVADAAA
jgi:hypothetical protein